MKCVEKKTGFVLTVFTSQKSVMELRFQAILNPFSAGTKNVGNSIKTIDSIVQKKQLTVNKIWSELISIQESHYSLFHTIYPEPNDTIENIKKIIFKRINNYFPTFDDTQYEWKMIHKGQELQNNKSLNDFNIEHGSGIYARIYLFGIGINTHSLNIDVEQVKSNITHLLSQLTTNEKQQMFEIYTQSNLDIFSVLQRSLINFTCSNYNKDSFYSVYDILLLLLKNGLSQSTGCIDKIYEYFYELFHDNNFQSLYLKLILIVKSNNESILSVLTADECSFKWVDGAFKDWEMSPDIIRSLLINGYEMIDYVETSSDHWEKNDYITHKLNCYLFIIYDIHNQIINEYCQVLQAYIHSNESIQIIISYVMNLGINDSDLQNINNNFNPQKLCYLNDERWKTWKQQNNFDMIISEKTETSMRLLVRMPGCKIRKLKGIFPSNTIDVIKLKIETWDGIPQKMQRLIKGNTILNDAKKVSYYNIQGIKENYWYGTPSSGVFELQIAHLR
eukprot:450608_1